MIVYILQKFRLRDSPKLSDGLNNNLNIYFN